MIQSKPQQATTISPRRACDAHAPSRPLREPDHKSPAPRQIEPVTSRDVLEAIQRQMFRELGHDHLSKYARPRNTAAHRTLWSFGSHHTVSTAAAGILGQYVYMERETGRDVLKHACLILANACLRCSALVAGLVGLRDIVLDTNLRQSIIIGLA